MDVSLVQNQYLEEGKAPDRNKILRWDGYWERANKTPVEFICQTPRYRGFRVECQI